MARLRRDRVAFDSVRWTGTVTLEIAAFSAGRVSSKVLHYFSHYLCKTLRNRRRTMFFLIGLFYWRLMDLHVKYLNIFFFNGVDFSRREFCSLVKIARLFRSKKFRWKVEPVKFDISIRFLSSASTSSLQNLSGSPFDRLTFD